jgi:hypothetical protein
VHESSVGTEPANLETDLTHAGWMETVERRACQAAAIKGREILRQAKAIEDNVADPA